MPQHSLHVPTGIATCMPATTGWFAADWFYMSENTKKKKNFTRIGKPTGLPKIVFEGGETATTFVEIPGSRTFISNLWTWAEKGEVWNFL